MVLIPIIFIFYTHSYNVYYLSGLLSDSKAVNTKFFSSWNYDSNVEISISKNSKMHKISWTILRTTKCMSRKKHSALEMRGSGHFMKSDK